MMIPANRVILVVDDENRVRQVAAVMLQNAGFEVITAADGLAALARAREHTDDLDLLLTDLTMPQMDGLTLAAQVRQACPRTRVLFMSGDTNMLAQAKATGWPVLAKPFSMDTLLSSVRAALGGEAEAEARTA